MAEKSLDKMNVLGVMSGTSLDGLDLALCSFEGSDEGFLHSIIAAKTIPYSTAWKKQLTDVKNAGAEEYFGLHAAYGRYIAEEINAFLKTAKEKPGAIASHGHTVFHNPKLGFSTQIGCGATIAAQTGINTVCDFRSLDVAGGGQGAPLVPIGDKLLFKEYQACLNIGGIANISFDDHGKRIAYDVCVANMALNFLSEKTGKDYDGGGEIARSGKIDTAFLTQLNALPYYSQKGAKSIGREWFETHFKKLLEESTGSIPDLLATCTEHIAEVIARELNGLPVKNILLSGGGTFNSFLIESLRKKTKVEIVIPSNDLINFKEALIFAFLGYLRLNQTVNTLATVTGAKTDSIGGAVYIV